MGGEPIDGDGDMDLVAKSPGAGIDIGIIESPEPNAAFAFVSVEADAKGLLSQAVTTTGDFNGDGVTDIVASTSDDRTSAAGDTQYGLSVWPSAP